MENLYDAIIIGGGPSGLSAAIYMARAKYKVLVLEKEKFGGQITITHEVVNYPGVFKTSGTELTKNMQKQAENFGAQFKIDEVIDIGDGEKYKTVKTTSGEYKTLGVILCVGANPRTLGFDGEAKFKGRGVAYCATCDGEFFTGMEVYVVGGGFAAVEEGIFLTKYASKVHMIVRGENFTCAKTVYDHVFENSKIDVRFNTEVENVSGEETLESITLKNNQTGEIVTESPEGGFGVFVFAGYVPNTNWLPKNVEKDRGYIVTDKNGKTNIDGIYAAGDVCIKDLRQVVTAVSDGATCATSLEKYCEEMHIKHNIPDLVTETIAPKFTEESTAEVSEADNGEFISAEIKASLAPVFDRFESKVILKGYIANDELSQEMTGFVNECKTLNEKLICSLEKGEIASSYMELFYENGNTSGVKFQGIPGGHEFNSFILALYNVAGPGKEIPAEIMSKIANINKPIDLKVLISLSCTMCPDVVVGAQQIASKNGMVTATMIDLQHAKDLKEKHKVMSVPCLIINDEKVSFGKKNIADIMAIIESL